ncbi:MAG: DUF115 domain-containing protein [PVC group bacterium]|nr:DUF115 domain-containing protein [PVC group bacterium]
MLTNEEVLKQSQGAFKQWEKTWEKNCKRNAEILKEKGYSNFRLFGHGVGRSLICIAFADSLKDSITDLKKKNPAVDIACVDKAMSYLLDNNIKPQFVYLADAGIDYEKWCKPYLEQTEDICLIMNVTANPLWAENWKGKVFYCVNQDNIKSEDIYAPLSGCNELVKASSNVGNTVIVHSSTYMQYDNYYLVGYDFCWSWKDNYYCGTDSDKRWYMNHNQLLNGVGDMVSTSQNLLFSVRWLQDFINIELVRKGKLIFTTSKKGILSLPYRLLNRVLECATTREPSQKEMDNIINTRAVDIHVRDADNLNKALEDKKILEVVVRHLPPEIMSVHA